jgi:S-methylmethionine-dependent homocysteine/selenocysteine methylase
LEKSKTTENYPLLMDGGMGSELERRGFDARLPLWSAWAVMEAPDLVRQIHTDFLKAGARVLTTATFRTTKYSLSKAGMKDRTKELIDRAAQLARDAILDYSADLDVIIAGSIAPLEDCYHPESAPEDQVMIHEYTHTAFLLKEAGVDVLLVETQNSMREARLATAAALLAGLPVWISLMPHTAGTMFNGDPLVETAKLVHQQGAPVVLVNCCSPQIAAAAYLTVQKSVPEAKVGAYPNLLKQELSPGDFAQWGLALARQDAHLIGGCCGTTPEHIQALGRALQFARMK